MKPSLLVCFNININMNSLCNILVMNGGKLIAVNKSRYFQKSSHLALGSGAFVSGLEFSADCQAHVVGKPSKQFFEIGKN